MATNNQRLVLDSKERNRGTPSCCTFVLPAPGIRAKSYEIQRIEIPHTFYNVTSTNNSIVWTDNTPTGQTSTIPVGNYSIADLLTEIGTQMTADTSDGSTYSASKSDVTKKITITNSLLGTFVINWGTDASDEFARLIGFDDAPVGTDLGRPAVNATSTANTHTGNNNYWIGKPTNIYIRSNMARLSSVPTASMLFNNGGLVDIIQKVQVSTVYGESIIYESNYPTVHSLNNYLLYEINLRLMDDEFVELDLNGRDWSLEIVFHL